MSDPPSVTIPQWHPHDLHLQAVGLQGFSPPSSSVHLSPADKEQQHHMEWLIYNKVEMDMLDILTAFSYL